MKKNVGRTDQLARYVLAIVFLVVAIMTQIWWFLIGTVVMAVTGALGVCWLYSLFGISTCRIPQMKQDAKEQPLPEEIDQPKKGK